MRNWEAKCEMAPPRGSYGKTNASEAPTLSRDKGKGVARRGKGTATRAQLHAQEAAKIFKDHIPLIARKATERMEKELWEQVKSIPIKEVR